MAYNNITILHLSDMQFGINHRFGAESTELDSLLERLVDDLSGLGDNLKPDLIVLSGDLTEWGKKPEFEDLLKFVIGLSEKLQIPRKRIVMIPGNHDVNRVKCKHYFESCDEEGSAPQEPYWKKWHFYKRFFDDFYVNEPEIQFTEEKPYSLFVIPELKIVVAGLNSTMRESHCDEDHYGWVGEKQLKWFKTELETYKQQGWFRIAAVHHNVRRGAENDDENLRDANDLEHILKDSVNLVLHGHTHQANLVWLTRNAAIVATGSAGLKQKARPDGVPNQYQIIQLHAHGLKRYCRAFIAPKKSWCWDNHVHDDADQPFKTETIAFENINAAFTDVELSILTEQKSYQPISASKKIAVLTADPINKRYDYSELLKGFKKLKCEVYYFYLSCTALNELDGYDYIFILSKLIKNKIVIEDDYLKSRTISLNELEENIGNTGTKGVFIFLDQLVNVTQTTALSLPTVIFPSLSKSQIDKFIFQAFTKVEKPKECLIINETDLKLCDLKDHFDDHHYKTALPEAIDPKKTQRYVGRVSDLEVICQKIIDLKDEKNGFLTIKGSGGLGKTITVKKITVALATRNLFPEGIDFVDCEFISDYKLFEFNVARTFNLEQSINVKEHIRKHHITKNALLILDNFETLLHLPDVAEIKAFLNFICDYVTIVVTSRELLELECEQIYELRRFTTDEAIELFLQEINRKITDSEQKLLRNEIIETLLDNNPLAIKLITKNLPKGKSFEALKRELEEDIFEKLTDSELQAFDNYSDTNIERKKSLYASINFSYRYLNDVEKMTFELLSLFPDGIYIENLKRITEENRNEMRSVNKTKLNNLCINDMIINSLDKKSIIENNNGVIRLQSIVGRFADRQLKQRDNMQAHYHNAFDYNFFLNYLLNQILESNKNLALKIFNNQKNNFLKSVSYIDTFDGEKCELLDYLDDLSFLFSGICTNENFINELTCKRHYFSDNKNEKLYFDLILLTSRYYDGDFENAYKELIKQLPKDKIEYLNFDLKLERTIGLDAINIYGMEGEAYFCTKIRAKAQPFLRTYDGDLFYIGEYNSRLSPYLKKDFFLFEIEFNSNRLDYQELDKYLKATYEKSHIEIMSCFYLKAKMGFIDRAVINKLVIVNPYTQGLQQLIFAFCETDTDKSISLYEQAKDNLKHIKYYYVEALFYYSKFLKEAGLKSQFTETYQQGFELAQKHYFRFLIYKFEDLIEPKTILYDPKNYPLPDNTNFDDYINFLIKHHQKQKR